MLAIESKRFAIPAIEYIMNYVKCLTFQKVGRLQFFIGADNFTIQYTYMIFRIIILNLVFIFVDEYFKADC